MAEAGKLDGSSGSKTGFNTTLVVLGVLATLFLVYGLSLFLQGGFATVHDRERQAKVLSGDNGGNLERAEQQAILDEGVRWIDQATGKVGIPIEDAKDLVVNKGR